MPSVNLDAVFRRYYPFGFHVQPWQPPHRAPERKFGGLARGDDGTEGPFIYWTASTAGWEIQSWQPPHPWTKREAAFLTGDAGIQGKMPVRVFYAFSHITQAYAVTVTSSYGAQTDATAASSKTVIRGEPGRG